MASETQSGGDSLKQNTEALYASIDFNANDRDMCLATALEEIGISEDTAQAMRSGEPITIEDSEKIFAWLQGDQEPGTIHRDTMEAIQSLMGKEAVGHFS